MPEPLLTREQIEACIDLTMAPRTMRINGVVIHLDEWHDYDFPDSNSQIEKTDGM